MIYDIPKNVEVCGQLYSIRSDYRAILDICVALSDCELDDRGKGISVLTIFYPDIETMPQEHYEEAIKKCFWFINGGEEDQAGKQPKLMDWEQDFPILCAPVNRVLGKEIRSVKYLHWWTFLSAYREIGGDCTFAQVVSIRDKLARNKKLEKHEREWFKRNKKLVEIKTKYTEAEESLLKEWI